MKILPTASFGVVLALVTSISAGASEPVRIPLASTFPGHLPLIGEAAQNLVATIERVSGGSLVFDLNEPGVLVPAAETVNAVSDGRVAAAWAGAGWFAGRDSAFNMFSTLPFGPDIGEYLAWMYHGGGLELAHELFHAEGVHNIPCAIIPPEASGWFHREITAVEDLKGLKMRFFGLGARVMQKLGVETQQLAPGDILKALQDNRIDAAEFSLPIMDKMLGFEQVAKFYYFPGWHQQATFFDLYLNLDQWQGLSEQHRALIEVACGDTIRAMIARGEAGQWKVLKDLQAQGIQLKRWPPEILVALEDAWHEVLAEESEANPNFQRVYQSYAQFRSDYRIWRHLSYLQ